MIYLWPHSGLGNRIRVIVSGLHFSDKTGEKLVIYWKKDNSLYCNFEDIYEHNEKFSIINVNFFNTLLYRLKKTKVIRSISNFALSNNFVFEDKDVQEYVWDTGTNNINIEILSVHFKNYYFFTCHEFYFDAYYLKFLKPIAEIQEKIENVAATFSKKTIGIHIRRTDHIVSINVSPLELFISIIRKDLKRDPDIDYFLATDDPAVETTLKKQFPGKFITYKKDFSRSTVKGIRDAMVDIYCLAATVKIYGSFYSSFSDIASRIGAIPLKIIK